MRHDEFHDRLQDACRWEAYIQQPASQNSEPFYISAKVTFEWGSHKHGEGKRARKGLLTELIGRKQRYPKTQLRWTRVDLRLHASFTAVTVDHSWHYLDDWRASGIEPWTLVR